MSATRGEQDPGARRHHLSAGVEIGLRDRAEQPSQSASVVEHPDSADPRRGHRAGMSHSDADAEGAILPLFVAETEAVATASLALAPRKPNPDSSVAVAGLCVGGEARPKSTAASSNTCAATSRRHGRPVTCLVTVPSGAATKMHPADSLRFQPLKALIRSYPDQGTAVDGSAAWARRAAPTS